MKKIIILLISFVFSASLISCIKKQSQKNTDNSNNQIYTPEIAPKPIGFNPPDDKKTSPFGVTASSIQYYMSEIMLIDAFKQSGKWLTKGTGSNSWDSGEQAKLDLDENGWVKSLTAKGGVAQNYNRVGKLVYHDTNGKHTAGKHIVLFDGEGDISYHLGATKIEAESSSNRHIVNMPKGNHASFLIVISRTNPDNYIRNIRVIKPGGICDTAEKYAASASDCSGKYTSFEKIYKSQVFHPYFIDGIKHYRLLRGMDIQATPTATFSTWQERPKLDDATWADSTKGAPFEILVTYANISNSDLWINIPARVDNDYVKKMATYIKANLNSNLKVYTEYFDEAWNMFGVYLQTGGRWMRDKGRTKWGQDTNAFESILNWYGMRNNQICKIFKDEFGADKNRIKCTLNSQASNAWVSEQMLECPLHKAKNGKNCAEYVDYLSIAPYFGGYLGERERIATVANWTLDQLFNELETGNILNYEEGGLATPKKWIVDSKKVADKYGVGMIAYEGGQHLVSLFEGRDEAERANIKKAAELFISANRDTRMKALYKTHLKDWKDAGGELFVAYTNMSQYGRYGSWGNKESREQTDAPKALAFEEFQKATPCWWQDCEITLQTENK